jgi:hypothetical protein
MNGEYEKELLEDIESSGFPLEIDAANQLIEKGWSVIPQFPYLDERTKKIHTVDFVAYYITKEELNYTSFPRLVVECKTTRPEKNRPWIFHSTHNPLEKIKEMPEGKGIDLLTMSAIPSNFVSLLQGYIDYENLQSFSFPQEIFDIITQSHFFDNSVPRAYSCYVAFLKQNDEDSPNLFRKAVYQVKGACLDLAKAFPKWPILATIVYNGDIYEYRRDLEPKLKPCKHLLYWTLELLSEDLKPQLHSIPPFVIDIVNDAYFSDYLELLKKDFGILMQVKEALKRVKP